MEGFHACFALWLTGWAFWRVQMFYQCYYWDGDLWIYGHLPVLDREVFRLQWRKFLRQPSIMLVVVPVALCVTTTLAGGGWRALLPALAFAALIHAACVCLTLFIATRLPQVPHVKIAFGFCSVAAGLFIWLVKSGEVAAEYFRWAYWLPPFGWINYAFLEGYLGGYHLAWLLLLPVAAMVVGGWRWRATLEATYAVPGEMFSIAPTWSPQVTGGDAGQLAMATDDARAGVPEGSQMTELENSIRRRDFLASMDWKTERWFEWVMARWLGSREKLVASLLCGGPPTWTKEFVNAIYASAVTMIILWFLAGSVRSLTMWGCIFVAYVLLPALGGYWRGFGTALIGSQFSPMYAGFPVSHGEIFPVVFKVNLLRSLAAAPVLVLFGMAIAVRAGETIQFGIIMALKTVGLVIALQPTIIATRLSGCASGYQRPARLWQAGLVPLLLVGLGAGFTLYASQSLTWALVSLAIVAIIGVVVLISCFKWYERGWFDQLSNKPDELSGPG
ncbi:MAG: hypothetical protein AB1705_05515 [Verrucomicrobiota bacterium]